MGPAASSSTISDMWVAPSMTRCTLLVDRSGMSFCAGGQTASRPLPAVGTTKGLSAKSLRDAAWSIEDPAWMYSSIVLRTWLWVAKVQRDEDQGVSRQPLEDLRAAEIEIRPIGTELINPSDAGHGGDHFAAD